MKAISQFLGASALFAAIALAAPAGAQYYPGPYGYGQGGAVGQVLNQVFGGWGYNGYGPNTQMGVQQCAAAVAQRINSGYGGGYAPYGGYGAAPPAGYGGYGGGRVVAITHADRHSSGRVKVKGIATSGMAGGYGGYGGHDAYGNHIGYGGQGYGAYGGGDLKFNCTVEYNGVISHLDIDRRYGGYPY